MRPSSPAARSTHRIDRLIDVGHAVVTHDDQRQVVEAAARVDAAQQFAERAVLLAQLLPHARRIRAQPVRERIRAVPPRHHETGTLGLGKVEPRISATFVDSSMPSSNGARRYVAATPCHGVSAHPEEDRGVHRLPLGSGPERLGLEPARIIAVVKVPRCESSKLFITMPCRSGGAPVASET